MIETCTCYKVNGSLFEDLHLAVKAEKVQEIANLFSAFVVAEGITTETFTTDNVCEFVSKKREELNTLLTEYIAKYPAD